MGVWGTFLVLNMELGQSVFSLVRNGLGMVGLKKFWGVCGGKQLTGKFDMLETVLAVRLGRVNGVENPDDGDGASMAGLNQTGGIGDDDKGGAGMVSVGCCFAIWSALSFSCVAAFCNRFSHLVEMVVLVFRQW